MPKKFGRINEGFLYKKMYGGCCQAAKKSGRLRGGRKAGFHFTVVGYFGDGF